MGETADGDKVKEILAVIGDVLVTPDIRCGVL